MAGRPKTGSSTSRRSRRSSAGGSSRAPCFWSTSDTIRSCMRITSWATPRRSTTTFTRFVGTSQIPNTDCVFAIQTPAFAKLRLQAQLSHVPRRELLRVGVREHQQHVTHARLAADTAVPGAAHLQRAVLSPAERWVAGGPDDHPAARHRVPAVAPDILPPRGAVRRRRTSTACETHLAPSFPIYIKDPNTGIISRAVRTTTNAFGGQALFAYQPVPGTVVFVGYGNNLTEPVSFRILTLTREADSFFVKFSYLFRM